MGLDRGGGEGAFGSGGVAHLAGGDRQLMDNGGFGLFDGDDDHLKDLGLVNSPAAHKEIGRRPPVPQLTMSGKCSSTLLPELA